MRLFHLLCGIVNSANSLQQLVSCWTSSLGSGHWEFDKAENSLFTSLQQNLGNPSQPKPRTDVYGCPNPKQSYYWNPDPICSHQLERFTVKKMCRAMRGRPLVFMGDSLSVYSASTLINAMANHKQYVENTPHHYRNIPLLEGFPKNRPSLRFVEFEEACRAVDEEPFLLFINDSQYLDRSQAMLSWLQNNSNAIMVINRGYHYSNDKIMRTEIPLTLGTYLTLLTPKEESPLRDTGLLIWRSIHEGHPGCEKYFDSPPFDKSNYSQYQSRDEGYQWASTRLQDSQIIRPIIQHLRSTNAHNASSRLIYLDILSSSRLFIGRHTPDCLHYCIPGPMESWITLVMNTIMAHNHRDL